MSNASGPPSFMFHHPFQPGRGFPSGLPNSGSATTPDTPLSPRAARAAFSGNIEQRNEEVGSGEGNESSHYGQTPSVPGYHNPQFTNTHGGSYWGSFPPSHHPAPHMLTHIPMGDPYRRDSTVSMGYDGPMFYGPHGDRMPGPVHNYHHGHS